MKKYRKLNKNNIITEIKIPTIIGEKSTGAVYAPEKRLRPERQALGW
jgi:hypothetical protein